MKVLVIGGTGFIRGEIVRLSIEAGHDVTLFNRGNSESPVALPRIVGDALVEVLSLGA